jgi:uncharacterized membrane protein HdeD (DUF308 family)
LFTFYRQGGRFDILLVSVVLLLVGWPHRNNNGAFIIAGFGAVSGIAGWAGITSQSNIPPEALSRVNRDLLWSLLFAGLFALAGGINSLLYHAQARRDREEERKTR